MMEKMIPQLIFNGNNFNERKVDMELVLIVNQVCEWSPKMSC